MKTRVVSCFCLRWLDILDTVFSGFFLFAVIVCYEKNKQFLVFVTFNLSNLFFPIQQTIRKQQHGLKFAYKTKNCELSISIITQCLRLEIPPMKPKKVKYQKWINEIWTYSALIVTMFPLETITLIQNKEWWDQGLSEGQSK